MSHRILCVNEEGVEIGFAFDFEPFFLVDCEGITSVYNDVRTSENSNMDGSTKQGITTRERFIVITAQMCGDYQNNREWLYRAFKPKTTGRLVYTEDSEAREVAYEVESVEIGTVGVVRDIIISLKCPDPFFRALDYTIIDMASWLGFFEFEHEFFEVGEAFGERKAEIIKEIENESAAKTIGITVTIQAEDNVVNPAIYHLESGDFIRLNFTMQTGDKITITTETNDKNVYLERQGMKKTINQFTDEDSEFMQLTQGTNTLKYDADSGIDYMNLRIQYKFKFLGV